MKDWDTKLERAHVFNVWLFRPKNFFFGGWEDDFRKYKIIFSFPQNKLSDVNKTCFRNRQKFELLARD